MEKLKVGDVLYYEDRYTKEWDNSKVKTVGRKYFTLETTSWFVQGNQCIDLIDNGGKFYTSIQAHADYQEKLKLRDFLRKAFAETWSNECVMNKLSLSQLQQIKSIIDGTDNNNSD